MNKLGIEMARSEVAYSVDEALAIADRAYVLETGNIILDGDAKVLMNDERIKKAYLGE